MESSPATHCHHVRTSGLRCGSLALRNKRYCYYHQRARPAMVNFAETNRHPVLLSLPLFEDAHAIQVTLHRVVFHLLEGHIGQKTAGLLLYAMQIASSNLKHIKNEAPDPEQVIVDLPKLSETPSPEPSEETARINSHTLRRTHFPYTPTTKDEYYDDVMRQERELREQPENLANEMFSPDLPSNLRVAADAIEGDFFGQKVEKERQANYKKWMEKSNFNAGNELPGSKPPETQASNKPPESAPQEKKASADKSASGKLPPGTIHGCAAAPRRANGNGGPIRTPSGEASSRS